MRAPQHERRARPPARGVAREPAEATLQGLTPTSPTPLPSWVRRLPYGLVFPKERVSRSTSQLVPQRTWLFPPSAWQPPPHPGAAAAPLSCSPPPPGDPRSKLPAPNPALAASRVRKAGGPAPPSTPRRRAAQRLTARAGSWPCHSAPQLPHLQSGLPRQHGPGQRAAWMSQPWHWAWLTCVQQAVRARSCPPLVLVHGPGAVRSRFLFGKRDLCLKESSGVGFPRY